MKSASKHGHIAFVSESPPRQSALLGEYVPLSRALALCLNDDPEEGLTAIRKAVHQARHAVRKQLRWKATWLALGIPIALIALVTIVGDFAGAFSPPPALFMIETIAVMQPVLALLIWQVWQYGTGPLETPRNLPHEPDMRIEALMSELQKASGPRVHRMAHLSTGYVPLNHTLFFGRLRYLVLSEHFADRLHVHSCRALLPTTANLYVTRADAEGLLAGSKPKRKGGPGRDPKYPYLDAALDAMLDGEIIGLDLSNPDAAMHRIERWLVAWFENHVSESGDVPRIDLVRPYARRVFEALSRKT